jgi:hypothetical protein
MDERYGRSKRARRDRKVAIWIGGGVGAALILWIFSTAFLSPFKTSGEVAVFKANSSMSATVIINVTKPQERKVLCGVSVLNGTGGSVGSKQVVVDLYATTVQVSVNTTELGTDGHVDFCRVI